MKLQPLRDNLIVEPIEEETERASGLVLPDQARERPNRGQVLEVGPEVETPAVGDIVIYSMYAGTEIDVGEDSFVLMRAPDVLAIIRKEE